MKFIRIHNFEKLQHYRDRRPPWIKLYANLLHDDRFFELSEADRYQVVGLFILASQHDNRIPLKEDWLRRELAVKRPIALQRLIDTHWIEVVEQDASNALHESTPLAERSSLDSPRAHAESRDRDRDRDRDREEKPPYPLTGQKQSYGKFENVFLSTEERQKLTGQFGESGAVQRIENLSEYVESKGVKYRSHYATILNWERKNGNGTQSRNGNAHPGAPGSGNGTAARAREYVPRQ